MPSITMNVAERTQQRLAITLEKLLMIVNTPGAMQAKKAGCYLGVYSTLYRLNAYHVNPSTILDIGANRGMFTRTFHHLFPQADILAFEPLVDCYNDLCSLKALIRGLECYNVALADQSGEDWIHRSSYDYSSSILEMDELHKRIFPYTANEQLKRIKKETLDAILGNRQLKRPTLMKMDVQGFEKNVLDGADQSIEQVDYVLCEMSFVSLYKQQPLFDEIYRWLTGRGFHFAGHIAESQAPKSGQLLQIDGLFLR